MPPLAIPILLSQPAIERLTVLKDAHNAEAGTALTLSDWITLHLRELAVNREWSDSVQSIVKQLETDSNAAIRSERERLLGLV